ncbi:MAG: hypothetical protein M3Y79_10650, partial [Pseudomonadota bacterium]|nr:hypothetical protein [Pseudomonadota bacterium]
REAASSRQGLLEQSMSRTSRVRRLSLEQAAYLGGIIDGEGTVTLTRVHANESRRLVVSIANTELELLQHVHEVIGAGKITRKRVTSVRHSASYHYFISCAQALTLLEQVAPYLRTYKRDRAHLALLHYRALTPRNGRYSPELRLARLRFESAFLATLPKDSARNGWRLPVSEDRAN